ncbi:MAG: glycosyltransferase family 39 protein [Schleiferiaceae bacterium]|nr:glycosyltransferase family 39 protein [Schleiferiaceae bacterium]
MGKKQVESKETVQNSSKSLWIFSGILLVIFFIAYQFVFDKKLDLGGDNGGYYILGKALSTGNGYTNIHHVGDPAHNHFPPGYPALLAIFMFFSDSIIFLKIMNGVLLAGSALLLFKVFSKVSKDYRLAFVASLLMLFNMHLMKYSTIMMSEIPFLFFGSLTLLLFLNSSEKENIFKSPSFYGTIIVSSYAFHIRTAGIALIGGIILYLLIQKNWKYLVSYTLGFIALGIPWYLRGQSLGGSKYLKQLFLINPYRPEEGSMGIADWFTRFTNNLTRYISKEIPHGVFPGAKVDYSPDAVEAQWFLGILCLALIIFGLIKLKNYRTFFIGYIGGTFGILLLWPDVWFSVRFMLPLIPIFLFLIIYAIIELLGILLTKAGINKAASPYLALILAFFFLPQLKELNEAAKTPYPKRFNNYFKLGSWADKNLPENAVIITRKPNLFYLTAKRKLANFKSNPDYNTVLDGMKEKGATHVVLDQLGYSQTGRYLYPVIIGNPEKFQGVQTIPNPDTYMFAFNYEAGYHGEWKQGKDANGNLNSVKHGQGVMKNAQGVVYQQGEWKDGNFVQSNEVLND